MKKVFCCFILAGIIFGVTNIEAFAFDPNYYIDVPATGVLCNKKQTKCTVGYYTMYSKRKLYVGDGIVCNHKKNRCTNGYTYMRSRKSIF